MVDRKITGFIQVMTTVETKEQARAIAQSLVGEKLAACVQIVDSLESTYRWKGKVESVREYLCLIKTRENLFPKVEAAVLALHSYETPEIIAVPVVDGSEEYLRWLDESLA
jgi:periplasmic divalent cation tolerance protein